MIKGLAVTPPILGRISIGKVVEINGKRIPAKEDAFSITSQVQGKDGWVPHPFDEGLRKAQGGKIRSIPIRLLFNDPDLNFRAEYSLFDRDTGRPLCVGNGESCKRFTAEGIKAFPCPSPEGCPLAVGKACKPFGRLNVIIGDEDDLGTFIFRTTGFNSIRTLTARLHYFQAVSGNRLACMPLELRLRGKSTRQSHGAPIYYVDITSRSGMSLDEALQEARRVESDRQVSGFDQSALDAAARLGFANGAFEESEEEADGVVEEFFAETTETDGSAVTGKASGSLPAVAGKPTLAEKLETKAAELGQNQEVAGATQSPGRE